jgi:hypothetical protein
MLIRRGRCALCATLVLMLCTACGDRKEDPHRRVGTYRGRFESDLRREVGAPSTERRISATEDPWPCERRADRELIYDIPSRGFAKRVREMFRMGPSFSYTVCVDPTGKIIGISASTIN